MVASDSYDKLKYRVLSGQPGSSRGAWSGDPVLPWKANLIALSQRDNLYFVALHETIYVDRPNTAFRPCEGEFVSELRWKLPASPESANSTHHHNSRYPHAVNRLEIGSLGAEEVLISACDDGDVIVYLLTSIQLAFEAIDEGLAQHAAVDRYLRPLYQYNVGKSAWGIAIQKESRLIAISSNKAEVTLRAAAISISDPASIGIPTIYSSNGGAIDRNVDHTWTLQGHGTNIPALSFYYTRETSPSVYLISSDIGNNVLLWNLSATSQLLCKINIEYHDLTRQYGWLVYPIGPEAFRPVSEIDDLHGCAADLGCDEGINIVSLGVPSSLDQQVEQLTGSVSAQTWFDNLPFSIVHTSSERVTLLHKPFNRIASCFVAPWRDATPPFQDHHGTPGTMRYARYIPELGVLVAGSDLGHVGVFTLTRLNRATSTDAGLGMRLDQILPLESQIAPEQRLVGFSGFGCLIGIATAPMLGSVRGRYRLVLEYANRTLLSYELWRT